MGWASHLMPTGVFDSQPEPEQKKADPIVLNFLRIRTFKLVKQN